MICRPLYLKSLPGPKRERAVVIHYHVKAGPNSKKQVVEARAQPEEELAVYPGRRNYP